MPASADIRLIAFDVDGTLVDDTVYIWETLHTHFGCDRDARTRAARDFFDGRISYRQWFEHDIAMLRQRGATRQAMLQVVGQLRAMPGAHETLRELRRRGYKLAVISGSLDLVLQHFFGDLRFEHVLINHFEFDASGALSGGAHTPYDLARKADGLAEVAAREGLTPAQCAFVGDNVNDLQVLQVAGLGVALRPKRDAVREAADAVIEVGDLSLLLPLFPPLAAG
ncbi:MAG: HAD family phosphatase [Pseudomonadota bacterium]